MFIDLIIFILMFVLMFYSLTGNLWHEILGIITFILFIVHNLLNINLIKGVLFKVKEGKEVPSKIKLNLGLDLLMGISLVFLMISGILISESVFQLNMGGIWITIHDYAAYILFGLIIVHLLCHLKMVSSYLASKTDADPVVFNVLFIIIISIMSFIVYHKLFTSDTKKESNDSGTTQNNSSSNNGSSSNSTGGSVPTLQEYLSTKHCSGCHNNCILSAIRCNRGTSAKESATNKYYAKYSSTTSSTTSSNTSNEFSDGNVTYTFNIN